MTVDNFDYKTFAAAMAEQAKDLVPKDLKDFEREYVIKTLGNFTLLAGEALCNDESLQLTEEQAVFITQLIAEWSFYKSIDLINSGILPEYWDNIMQKIAFTIFDIAKRAVLQKIPQDRLLEAIEQQVTKVYKESIAELEQRGIIDAETKTNAENQSHIITMAEQAKAEQQKEQELKQQAEAEESEKRAQEARKAKEERRAKERQARTQQKIKESMPKGISHKQLKLMSLALVLKVLSQDKVTTILNKFNENDSMAISSYMDMADLESHIDGDLVNDCLKEIKKFLPVKKKLTKENIISNIAYLQNKNGRESLERVVKNERPLVKRFVTQAIDGEYGDLPLKVAGIINEYIEENV